MMKTQSSSQTPISYLALLRGINVGGNNIIKMEQLRKEFEEMGFLSVKTFIQSGNVLFLSGMTDKGAIEDKIEKALSVAFDYKAKVLVRSKTDMENTVMHIPAIFKNNNWKHNVVFLSNAIDSKAIITKLAVKKDIETVLYYSGVLFWSAKQDTLAKSTMIKLSSRAEYREMTVRNVNTTVKLLQLMNDVP
jgi:uncharacterized protein (DUF1697 family)